MEDPAEVDLLHRPGDAPGYWMAARTPPTTPSGAAIPSTTGIASIHEGTVLAASDRHTRTDLRFIPVRGLENTSQLGLVWRTGATTPPLTALGELLRAGRPGQAAGRPAGEPPTSSHC